MAEVIACSNYANILFWNLLSLLQVRFFKAFMLTIHEISVLRKNKAVMLTLFFLCVSCPWLEDDQPTVRAKIMLIRLKERIASSSWLG